MRAAVSALLLAVMVVYVTAYSCRNHMNKYMKADNTLPCAACVHPPSAPKDRLVPKYRCVFDPNQTHKSEQPVFPGACKLMQSAYWTNETSKMAWARGEGPNHYQLYSSPAACESLSKLCFASDVAPGAAGQPPPLKHRYFDCLLTEAAVRAAADIDFELNVNEFMVDAEGWRASHLPASGRPGPSEPTEAWFYSKFAQLARNENERQSLRNWFVCVHRKYANDAPLLWFLQQWLALPHKRDPSLSNNAFFQDPTNCPHPTAAAPVVGGFDFSTLTTRLVSAEMFSFWWKPHPTEIGGWGQALVRFTATSFT